MEKILEIKHLGKSFGTHEVLKDIDFTVKKGDVTSIIGASGSGKSTLLRCINLLYFPSAVIEMVGYLTLTLLASFGLRWLEKWLDGADNYELVSVDSLAMSAGTYSHPDRGSPFDEQSKEFSSAKELKRERRERKLQELRYGRPKGDR